ncbi:hypothetical protein Gain_0138_004 [Komagataeibacter intermedius TF2]|uniref:Uncharacterized protein n=1 Tax=Komagataeibacter intermedius NRIC 0521 TaxID=1307934 RepID=A0ABQ0PJ01_9PROT|nr:hypothetical protein Gain_0138_004 [Komagataeibacter intermedius TF2]GBQ71562.1 hypothetical protein AA0521_1933 [Komagataeibacter intermedius NRIC 0521]
MEGVVSDPLSGGDVDRFLVETGFPGDPAVDGCGIDAEHGIGREHGFEAGADGPLGRMA